MMNIVEVTFYTQNKQYHTVSVFRKNKKIF